MSMGMLAGAARQVGGRLIGDDRSYSTVSTDTRALQRDQLFVALQGPSFDGHEFVAEAARRGAAGAVVSRLQSSALAQVEVADTRAALGKLAHAWRLQFDIPLIAVTGSNGKTTVKEMIAAILRRAGPALATRGNLNNDIGVPLTLLELRASHRAAIVEMGASHSGEIGYLTRIAAPGVGVVTNAGAAHLEGFGSTDDVARAKGELFAGLPPGAVAVINADDPYCEIWKQSAGRRRIVTFGLMHDADMRADAIEQRLGPDGARLAFDLHMPEARCRIELSLAGRHNVMNAVAAAAAARAAGAALTDIQAGLAAVRQVPGRLQLRPGIGGARILDDTYNANPCSLAAALNYLTGLEGRAWVVLGDMRELGAKAASQHAEMGALAARLGVERLYGVGPLSRHAVEAFGAGGAWFATTGELTERLEADLGPGVNLLVKASRGMRLERVIAAVAADAGETAAQGHL
ncbi:MAG TPA: UDP-N-acetylmuramoyl-tripeptide--D-alanyl-D-alanine ligase [Gammaproteobacteria bacterium]|nr:UDP-N-acetylmuramoyl-tripeptide--D-alanyl-D-alanine ligase [Gammaproteobacteria bacterium]